MKITFLGTGSGGGLPGLFCNCPVCKKARKLRGKNVRTCCSIQVDKDCQVGFTPDVFVQTCKFGYPLPGIRHLMLTHGHYDHLAPELLRYRREPYGYEIDEPMTVYGNSRAIEGITQRLDDPGRYGIECVTWKAGKSYRLDDMDVTPVKVDHDPRQTCYALAMVRHDRRVLYAADMAQADEAFFKRLPEDMRFDLVVLDCSRGKARQKVEAGHMNLEAMLEAARKFDFMERLTRRGKVVATHFSHYLPYMHQEFDLWLHEHNETITVAYDGLRMDLNKDD